MSTKNNKKLGENMEILKVSIEINNQDVEMSLKSLFGVIPLSELKKIEHYAEKALKTLDYNGRKYYECEGYAEITFEVTQVNTEWNWKVISSFYHDLI